MWLPGGKVKKSVCQAIEKCRASRGNREVFDDNFRVYGIRKIWRAMRRAGWDIGREQTGRLMRLAGIYGARRGRRPVTTPSF